MSESETEGVRAGTSDRGFHRSLKWAFVMNWGRQGTSTLVTFALAGILGPHDFGTVTMASIYIAFLQLFLEQGMGAAIVQRERLEPEHLDSAFWMNIAWSLLLAGASVALSGWWARANHLPALEMVIDILSLSLIVRGLTVVQQAALEREMRFKSLALRSNVATAVGGGAGIALALAGAGVWALVAQQLISAVVSLGLLWSFGGWTPRLRFSPPHARQLFGFSIHIFFGNLGVFVNTRVDALLMGLYFGPHAVGLYRLANRCVATLLELTTRPVHAVSLPHFARLQNDPRKLRQAVQSCIHMGCVLTVPSMLTLGACGEYIMAALGPAWRPAAGPLWVLCVAGAARALILFTGPILQAVSKPHLRTLMIWSSGLVSAPTIAVVASLLQTAPVAEQVLAVAAATAGVVLFVLVPINLLMLTRTTGISILRLLPTLLPSLLSGLAAVAAVAAITASSILRGSPPFLALAIVGATAAASAAAVLLALEPGIRSRVFAEMRSHSGVTVPTVGS